MLERRVGEKQKQQQPTAEESESESVMEMKRKIALLERRRDELRSQLQNVEDNSIVSI